MKLLLIDCSLFDEWHLLLTIWAFLLRYNYPNLTEMRKLTTMVCCFFIALFYAAAQDQLEVHGKVVDEMGFPVPNALVALEGTEDVTYTDFKGFLALKAPNQCIGNYRFLLRDMSVAVFMP